MEESPTLEQVAIAKQQAETEAILGELNSTRWNRKRAAAILKIDYKALLYKMKKLGIEGKPAPATEVAAAAGARVGEASGIYWRQSDEIVAPLPGGLPTWHGVNTKYCY